MPPAEGGGMEISMEEIKADPEYFKKSCIYDMIYEDLQLNDWLYNQIF